METILGFELEVHLPFREDSFGMQSYRDPPDETPWIARKTIANELAKILQTAVKAPRVVKGIQTEWAVLPENSIDHLDHKGSYGVVEIVSPPMPFSEAINNLSKVFNYCESEELFTTDECGLHLNFSSDMWEENRIPVALQSNLVRLIDERLLLKSVDRLYTGYTKMHYDHLAPYAVFRMNIDETYKPGSDLDDLIGTGKEYAMNFEKLNCSRPYIEFRHLGGEFVLYDLDLVVSIASEISEAIQAAGLISFGRLNNSVSKKLETIWLKRTEEFESDVSNTLKVFKFLTPKMRVKEVGEVSKYEVLQIYTKYGVIALSNDREHSSPRVYLDLSNQLLMNVPGDVISQRGALELAEYISCYLLLKFKKYSKYKFPIKEVDDFLEKLLGESK